MRSRLILEEALDAEATDALGRERYERAEGGARSCRNGYRRGTVKTAEGAVGYAAPQLRDTPEPFVSAIGQALSGRMAALEPEPCRALDGVNGPACGIAMRQGGGCWAFQRREPSMNHSIIIGLDLAMSVFQAHGVDAEGGTIVRRQLHRSHVLGCFERLEPCLVGMEACSGAHHRARELGARGHEVRLTPPA